MAETQRWAFTLTGESGKVLEKVAEEKTEPEGSTGETQLIVAKKFISDYITECKRAFDKMEDRVEGDRLTISVEAYWQRNPDGSSTLGIQVKCPAGAK